MNADVLAHFQRQLAAHADRDLAVPERRGHPLGRAVQDAAWEQDDKRAVAVDIDRQLAACHAELDRLGCPGEAGLTVLQRLQGWRINVLDVPAPFDEDSPEFGEAVMRERRERFARELAFRRQTSNVGGNERGSTCMITNLPPSAGLVDERGCLAVACDGKQLRPLVEGESFRCIWEGDDPLAPADAVPVKVDHPDGGTVVGVMLRRERTPKS